MTLDAIASMLEEHPKLRLRIEAGERRNFFVAEARAGAGDNPVPPGYL